MVATPRSRPAFAAPAASRHNAPPMADLVSGAERFTTADMYALSDLVASAWTAAVGSRLVRPGRHARMDMPRNRRPRGRLRLRLPAFFLASRNTDGYPDLGRNLSLGPAATPKRIVQSLTIATCALVAIVNDAPPATRAVIFRRPEVTTATPEDFLPRAAVELASARARRLHRTRPTVRATARPLRTLARNTRAPGRCGRSHGTVSRTPTIRGTTSSRVRADVDDRADRPTRRRRLRKLNELNADQLVTIVEQPPELAACQLVIGVDAQPDDIDALWHTRIVPFAPTWRTELARHVPVSPCCTSPIRRGPRKPNA